MNKHPLKQNRQLFFRLLNAEGKLLFRCLPSFLAQTVCLVLLTGLVCFAALRSAPEDSAPVSIRICVVIPESDTEYNVAFRLITSTADLPHVLNFDLVDYGQALEAVRSNDAVAALVFPEGFITDAMYGNEMTLKLLLPGNSGFETLLFQDLAHTAVTMLLDIQNSCYAAHQVAAFHDLDYAYDDNGDEIAVTYAKAAFSRLDYFEEESLRATGDLDLIQHYGSVAVLLLFLLSGISFAPLFSWKNEAFAQKLAIRRISPFAEVLIPLPAIICYDMVMLLLLLGAACFIPGLSSLTGNLSWNLCVSALLVMFTCGTLICAAYHLVSSLMGCALVFLLGTVLMLFVSGGFVPSAYLPEALTKIAGFLPVSPMIRTLGCGFSGILSGTSLCITFLWGAGFYLTAVLSVWLARSAKWRAPL